MKKIVKEPLLHFVILGALVFVLYGSRPESNDRSSLTIVISSETMASLVAFHVERTGAEPTEAEQDALIRSHVEEEVLFREAIALGLDQGDPIVRRRLVQSMSFLVEDLAAVTDPSEEELAEYLQSHPERYEEPVRWSITHVFVSRERNGTLMNARAEALLDDLRGGADHSAVGEPFLRGSAFQQQSERDLDGIFGVGFSAQLSDRVVGQWIGPLTSTYGLHLVRIEQHAQPRLPTLAEIVDVVRRDWLAVHQSAANEVALQAMVDKYDVVLETAQ